jgi:hypothetical protein
MHTLARLTANLVRRFRKYQITFYPMSSMLIEGMQAFVRTVGC